MASLSTMVNGSAELLCPITSVDVHCEFEPPSCKQVAIESDGLSDESESRAIESDSTNINRKDVARRVEKE